MKKILFFINTLRTGGAERVLIDLVAKLPKNQYQITIQTLVGGHYEGELPEGVMLRRIVRTNIPALDRLLSRILSKLPRLTGRLFVRNDYDIEVAYLEGFPTKVLAHRTRSRAKKIAFVHIDVAVMDLISPQYPNKETCAAQYRVFDRVCFVSEQAKAGFFEIFGPLDHTEIVHNVIDFARIREQSLAPAPGGYRENALKMVAVGRLARQKGFDRLIRICAELEKEFAFELLILGDGELRQELEASIAESGVHSVRLVGMQSNPYPWMRQADLMVCSSFAEGYSTTVMEALALGLPVLTTACAGMDEILEGGKWGKLVGLSDKALCEGLREVLADRCVFEDLKCRAEARRAMLTDEVAIREYLQLFDRISEEAPGSNTDCRTRLLFFINSLNTGGAERVLINLVSKLPKDAYQITVQTLVGGQYEGELPKEVQLLRIIHTGIPCLDNLLKKVLSKLPRLTGRLFIKHDYDIEVAYLEGFPTKVLAARTKSRAKKVAVVHTNTAQTDMIRVLYPNDAACLAQYNLFDRTVFVSKEAMEGFFRMFGTPEHAQVVHNVIDFARVRAQAQEACPDNYTTDGMKLVAVGRLIPLKGFDRLIRICAELEKEFDFELRILGGGELEQELETVISETGAGCVRLMGMQANPYTWMQQADLMVCSSFTEGYSTTVMEALALGLPVITTACAGMDEILEGGKWGKIVGLTDDELRDGLREILSDRSVYEDLKQRAMIRKDQLTDEASVQEYRTLFDDIMSRA